MALHVCENINEDLFVIINKLFSTKYPIDIFDLTNWSKLIILLPCFQRFSLFSKVYLKSKLWVVKLLKLNIEKSWFYHQTDWSGPNLHIRFMKNCIHTSLLGSLAVHLQLAKCVTQLKRRCKSHFCICLLHFINTRAAPLWENKQINKFPIDANFISLWELMQWGWDFRKQSMYVAFKVLFCTCNFIFCNAKSCFGRYMTLKVFLKTCKVHVQ